MIATPATNYVHPRGTGKPGAGCVTAPAGYRQGATTLLEVSHLRKSFGDTVGRWASDVPCGTANSLPRRSLHDAVQLGRTSFFTLVSQSCGAEDIGTTLA